MLAAQSADFFHGLQDANLVVGGHDADQHGSRRESPLERVEVDQALRVHVQISHFGAELFQVVTGVKHGAVLRNTGDDVIAFAVIGLNHAFNSQVVALGCAGGEDNLARRSADQAGDLPAGG